MPKKRKTPFIALIVRLIFGKITDLNIPSKYFLKDIFGLFRAKKYVSQKKKFLSLLKVLF